MASQQLLQRTHDTPDFEGAQSLLQHSRGRREANGSSMPIAMECSVDSPVDPNEGQRGKAGIPSRQDRHVSSQEVQTNAEYGETRNSPSLGQMCR